MLVNCVVFIFVNLGHYTFLQLFLHISSFLQFNPTWILNVVISINCNIFLDLKFIIFYKIIINNLLRFKLAKAQPIEEML